MKKLLVLIVIIAAAAYFMFYQNQGGQTSSSGTETSASSSETGGTSAGAGADSVQLGEGEGDLDEDYDDIDIRPATELYSSSEDALEAVKKGALDYDDIILEQFVEIKDCEWCGDFYKSVNDLMLSEGASEDEQSYYSEILAISGNPDQVGNLVAAIKGAKDEAQADLFAESLELTLGGDDVVTYLKEELNDTSDPLLQESLVAAVTNQGSRLAVETLYDYTVTSGDPDGYYSVGIGLGEVVPEEEALPYLQELVKKRDPYSNLAFKALLNEGVTGLQMAMDELTNSPNPEYDKKMLEGAVDHVAYEEDVEDYLNELVKTTNDENVKAFAQEILEELAIEEEELEFDDELG